MNDGVTYHTIEDALKRPVDVASRLEMFDHGRDTSTMDYCLDARFNMIHNERLI